MNDIVEVILSLLLIGGIGFLVVRFICFKIKDAKEVWEKQAYKNAFGERTTDYCIVQKYKGHGFYSNNVERVEDLGYYTFFDANSVSFRFFEHMNDELENTESKESLFKMYCVASSGEHFETILGMPAYSSDVEIKDEGQAIEFINLFKNNESLKIIIRSGVWEFKFTMKRANFVELYDSLYSKE